MPSHCLRPGFTALLTVLGVTACHAGTPSPEVPPAAAIPAATAAPPSAPYLNPDLPTAERVADLISRMTLEEKVAQLQNAAPAIPRLGVPAYDWWSEALHGVARAGVATVFPQAIGLAATWDTSLMFRVATTIGIEARAKYTESIAAGRHSIYEGLTFWSPNINIVRDPRWGRGMETYGEDPFLTGRLAVQFVRGVQGDDPRYLRVVATAKHYAVHSGPEPLRHAFDAEVDAHDLADTYLPAFEAAVREGGATSVMCAYNRVDGAPACASDDLLGRTLRGAWGFRGYVVTDCDAVYDMEHFHHTAATTAAVAALALRAGTDLNCGNSFGHLTEAVAAGLASEADVDTAVARLFTARFRLGMFDPPARVPWTRITPDENATPEHAALALDAARRSIVLLTNPRDILPLGPSARTIAVIGPNADAADMLLGNYNGVAADPVTPLEGIRRGAPAGTRIVYAQGAEVAPGLPLIVPVPASALSGASGAYFANHEWAGTPALERPESTLRFDWLRDAPAPGIPADSFSAQWTATLTAPVSGRYALGVRAIGEVRLFLDDSLLVRFSDRHVIGVATRMVDLTAGEARRVRMEFRDRRADAVAELVWGPPVPGAMEQAVAAARGADVAVLFLGLTPGLEGEEMPVAVPGFAGGDRTSLDLPTPQDSLLRAVVATGTPTVVVLLSGSALSVGWAAEHAAAMLEAWYPGQAAGTAIADVLFGRVSPSGRLPVTFYRSVSDLPPFTDYRMAGRTYRYFSGDVLFPFGHGLSYAQFRYRDLQVPAAVTAPDPLRLSVEVENSGRTAAEEVVQVYVTAPGVAGSPIRALVGFQRVALRAGERRRVAFAIPAERLRVVDAAGARVWPGAIEIAVGGKQPGQHGLADAATTEVVVGRSAVRGR